MKNLTFIIFLTFTPLLPMQRDLALFAGNDSRFLTSLQELDLSNRGLDTLPEQITKLTNLQRLNLSQNNLKKAKVGMLLERLQPSRIQLEELRLNNNQLRKFNLSHWSRDAFTNLRLLHLHHNNLLKLYVSNDCSNLTDLDISHNPLYPFETRLPDHLPHLVSLNLAACGISDPETLSGTDISDDFILPVKRPSELTSLEHLDLSNNNLSFYFLPSAPCLAYLRNLRTLQLNNNRIHRVPHEIGQLPCLEKLNLENNELWSLDEKLMEAISLQELRLSHNPLWELPCSLHKLTALRVLTLVATRIHHRSLALARIKLQNCSITGEGTTEKRYCRNNKGWEKAFSGDFTEALKYFEEAAISDDGDLHSLLDDVRDGPLPSATILAEQYKNGGLLVGPPNERLADFYQRIVENTKIQVTERYKQIYSPDQNRDFPCFIPENRVAEDIENTLKKWRYVEEVHSGKQHYDWYPTALDMAQKAYSDPWGEVPTPKGVLTFLLYQKFKHRTSTDEENISCFAIIQQGWQEIVAEELNKTEPDTERCKSALWSIKHESNRSDRDYLILLNVLAPWAIKCEQQQFLSELYDTYSFIFYDCSKTEDPKSRELLQKTTVQWAKANKEAIQKILTLTKPYFDDQEFFSSLWASTEANESR